MILPPGARLVNLGGFRNCDSGLHEEEKERLVGLIPKTALIQNGQGGGLRVPRG